MIPKIPRGFHLLVPGVVPQKFPRIILLWLASWPACGMITCDKGTQGATMAEWAATSPTSIQPPKPDYEHTSISFIYINHVMWFLMLLCLFSIWIQAKWDGIELIWPLRIAMAIIAAWNKIMVLNGSDNGWICLMASSHYLNKWTYHQTNASGTRLNPWADGDTWVHILHCGYWCPGAKSYSEKHYKIERKHFGKKITQLLNG